MRETMAPESKPLIIVAVLSVLFCTLPGLAYSQEAVAVVRSLQGEATVLQAGYEDTTKLKRESQIAPYSMISTGAKSKLMLRWQEGLFTSLGASSSISSAQEEGGPVSQIQMVEGIARFTADRSVANPKFVYTVATPTISIRPDAVDQPVDFIVEVDDPSTTILTILAGKMRVVDRSSGTPEENVYESCRTVYFSQGKQPEVLTAYSDDLMRIVGLTTIAGTVAEPDTCPTGLTQQEAPSETALVEVQSYVPEYYVEDSYIDFYPYDLITVVPYGTGGYLAELPYIGSWFIPYAYAVSPAIVQVYVNNYLIKKAIYINQQFITNVRDRRAHLRQVMDVAGRAGNLGLVARARNEMRLLRARENWAMRKGGDLEKRLTNLDRASTKFRGQLPRGTDLAKTVADSFASSRNANIARNFENRVNKQIELQNRLTSLGQQEVDSLRGRLAAVRDPARRSALRSDLSSMSQNLVQGKIPITPRENQVGKLAQQIGKERAPDKRLAAQNELLTSLEKAAPTTGKADVLTPNTLSTLRSEVSRVPNPAMRRDLTNRVTELQRAVRSTERQAARQESPVTSPQRLRSQMQPTPPDTGAQRRLERGIERPGQAQIERQTPRIQPRVQQPSVQPRVEQPRVEPRVQQFQQPRVQQPRVQQPRVQQPRVQQPSVQPRAEQPRIEPRVQQQRLQPRVEQPRVQPRVQQFQQPRVQQPRVQQFQQPRVQSPRVQPQAQPRVQPQVQSRPATPRVSPPAVRGPAGSPAVRAPQLGRGDKS